MSELVVDPISAVPEPEVVAPSWSAGTRVAFRFAFCYFVLYALCCGNATVWGVLLPVVGDFVENWLAWPFAHAAQWLGQHVFHLTGVAAKLHGGGSGDRALDWLAVGVMLVVAVVATLVWTALDRRSTAYPRMFAWFRFLLRLTLGVAMMNYGLAKVFPLQMPPPSLAVLNEPFGNLSPMTLLWTMLSVNPLYEMICGAAEVIGGVLILFRRTALLGALITAFVVTNVVLYNYFFDVPVKIYASHLLLMALVVIVPDVRSLFGYFWTHVRSAPGGVWAPVFARRWANITTVVVEYWVLFVACVVGPAFIGYAYFVQMPQAKAPVALQGIWHVDSAVLNGQPKPYLTGDGLPMVDLVMEPSGRTMLRDSSMVLWRGGARVDEKKKTLRIGSVGAEPVVYALAQPDATHLVLTPTGDKAKSAGVLMLSKTATPAHYPLLERGFHWVNEWGLER